MRNMRSHLSRSILNLAALAGIAAAAFAQQIPATGIAVPQLAAVDAAMRATLTDHALPGGSIAIVNADGALVYARGFGFADPATQEIAQPQSLYRIADISQFVTAATVYRLRDEETLFLDSPIEFYLEEDPRNLVPSNHDVRIPDLKMRRLLNATSGFRAGAFGFENSEVRDRLGVESPVSAEDMVRFALMEAWRFDPGYALDYRPVLYNYAVAGRVIEATCQMRYEHCVRTKLLEPAGVAGMRIAQSLPQARQPDEVRYADTSQRTNIYEEDADPVPFAYGGFPFESADAGFGWLASPVDLVRLVTSIYGQGGQPGLLPQTRLDDMLSTTNFDVQQAQGVVTVNYPQGRVGWFQEAMIPGSSGRLEYFDQGNYAIAVLFNGQPADREGFRESVAAIIAAATAAKVDTPAASGGFVPARDLFQDFPASHGGKPAITVREGIVNGASFSRGGVSGSWLTIYGANLASTTRIWTGNDIVNGILPTELDGVRVTINGGAAAIYFVSPNQLNVQVGGGLEEGYATVQVTHDGVTSPPVLVQIRENSPGLFTYQLPGDSRTFAAAVHLDGAIVGDENETAGVRFAGPGDTLLLFGTGFEPSEAGVAAPAVKALPEAKVFFGVQGFELDEVPNARVNFVSPGLFQVNLPLRTDLQTRDYVVRVDINGIRSQNGVVIPFSR